MDGDIEALRVALAEAKRDHAADVEQLRRALASRDVIGQAKGIVMASMGCNAEEAFSILAAQSMAEDRKLVDVATEIADRAARRRPATRLEGAAAVLASEPTPTVRRTVQVSHSPRRSQPTVPGGK